MTSSLCYHRRSAYFTTSGNCLNNSVLSHSCLTIIRPTSSKHALPISETTPSLKSQSHHYLISFDSLSLKLLYPVSPHTNSFLTYYLHPYIHLPISLSILSIASHFLSYYVKAPAPYISLFATNDFHSSLPTTNLLCCIFYLTNYSSCILHSLIKAFKATLNSPFGDNSQILVFVSFFQQTFSNFLYSLLNLSINTNYLGLHSLSSDIPQNSHKLHQ